jgi:PEP-CTERM motif-containing protein
MREQTGNRTKKLAKALLAGTCLAGAGGVASASVVIEGLNGAPADFANTPNGYLLPVGATEVQGKITFTTDNFDYFEFTGLLGGAGFSLHYDVGSHGIQGFNDVGGALTVFATSEGFAGSVSGTIPLDGNVVVKMSNPGISASPYTIDLTAPLAATPEPGTMGLSALALGGALAWRRRRKQ